MTAERLLENALDAHNFSLISSVMCISIWLGFYLANIHNPVLGSTHALFMSYGPLNTFNGYKNRAYVLYMWQDSTQEAFCS